MVLYVQFFEDEYYGLVGFLLSASTLAMPFVAFGVQNTLIKFYSTYTGVKQRNFMSFMLIMPLFVIIPAVVFIYFYYDQFTGFLASKNEIVEPYAYLVAIIAVAMAYFEISYAWAKTQLQSVFGNLMNEVFHRFGIMLLLIAFAFDLLSVNLFLYGVAAVYVLRMLVMMGYAFHLKGRNLELRYLKNGNRFLNIAS